MSINERRKKALTMLNENFANPRGFSINIPSLTFMPRKFAEEQKVPVRKKTVQIFNTCVIDLYQNGIKVYTACGNVKFNPNDEWNEDPYYNKPFERMKEDLEGYIRRNSK